MAESKNVEATINASKSKYNKINLTYPSNLGGVYLALNFYDYRNFGSVLNGDAKLSDDSRQTSGTDAMRRINNSNRQSINGAYVNSGLGRIFLPIPENLSENYSMSYDAEPLNDISSNVINVALDSMGGIGNIFSNLGSGVSGQKILEDIGKQASDTSEAGMLTAAHLGFDAINTVTSTVVDLKSLHTIFDVATGTVVNPNMTLLFRGAKLRHHTFRWKFVPRSQSEAITIEKIKNFIKRAMHPTQLNAGTSAYLRYPAECYPEFVFNGAQETSEVASDKKKNFLFSMRPCVVTDVDLQYSPNGAPSLFEDGHVTTMTLTVQLMETSYSTREDFDSKENTLYDGYDMGLTQYDSPPEKTSVSDPYVDPNNVITIDPEKTKKMAEHIAATELSNWGNK